MAGAVSSSSAAASRTPPQAFQPLAAASAAYDDALLFPPELHEDLKKENLTPEDLERMDEVRLTQRPPLRLSPYLVNGILLSTPNVNVLSVVLSQIATDIDVFKGAFIPICKNKTTI